MKFGAATPSCVVPLGWTQPVCGAARMERGRGLVTVADDVLRRRRRRTARRKRLQQHLVGRGRHAGVVGRHVARRTASAAFGRVRQVVGEVVVANRCVDQELVARTPLVLQRGVGELRFHRVERTVGVAVPEAIPGGSRPTSRPVLAARSFVGPPVDELLVHVGATCRPLPELATGSQYAPVKHGCCLPSVVGRSTCNPPVHPSAPCSRSARFHHSPSSC